MEEGVFIMKTFDVNTDKLDYIFDYNPQETLLLKKRFAEINFGEELHIDDLRRVALWKLNRVLQVPDEIIEQLEQLAQNKDKVDVHSNEVKELIENMMACQGVGLPMATAILKFLRPDVFPIIDVRAYRALFGKKIYSGQYTVDLYLKYVERIYEIREQLNKPLSDIDELLYVFDKEHNGVI